ncbi:hypothetical protein FSS13T_15740 [Flavobacterium saliperosum S13]|uniref:Phage abortive infection protein n=2 Tax=Flavobacterium saliperosum TaxID=329186 RepID=A0A1G4VGL8_9FLAO|nr:hypothetical protein [Flavobacterium saliperosum]ESU25622.1 hypothetical protein FSS13T_15740 [Flavobacterium saliperosum S13]SCX06509.1 hypothetical protein SAMN02927925_01013 [Flavobacterium saliperosum]
MKIKLSKKQKLFLINVFIICSIISLILILSLKYVLPNKSSQDIATTIGGILGTFFSFFGSVLVYLALKAQIVANEIVQKQIKNQEETDYFRNKINLVNERINILKEEVNNFIYMYRDKEEKNGSRDIEYKGSQAIFILLSKNVNTFYGRLKRDSFELEPKFTELYKLLQFYQNTIDMIENEKFDNDSNIDNQIKLNFYSSLQYFFSAKIKWNFKSMENKKSKHSDGCPDSCGQNHGLPEELFDLVDKINSKLS